MARSKVTSTTRSIFIWFGLGIASLILGVTVINRLSSDSLNILIPQQPLSDAPRPPLLITKRQRQPSAYLDGQPVYLVQDKPPISHVQCLSENFLPNSWMYRSCRFENLCFDLQTKTFVLHPSKAQQHLQSHLHNETFLSLFPKDMISGGQHSAWLKQGRSKWIPESRNASNSTSYYALSDDVVWVSFYPWADCNHGHLLWDSFLPIYTLLEIFQLKDKTLFLTEMLNQRSDCAPLMKQMAPMMGVQQDLKIKRITDLELQGDTKGESHLVCAKHAANGMGWLTDHGLGKHGSRPRDFTSQQNVGRGPNLAGFREYALRNLGIPTKMTKRPPTQVTFSILSSKDPERRLDFHRQIEHLQKTLPDVQINRVAMWNCTVREQVEIATQSAIFISVGGGGTSSAFFLQQGAALILYGKEGQRYDWDLWNNYAHIRVHWLSTTHLDQDIDLLVDLIRVELERIESSENNIM